MELKGLLLLYGSLVLFNVFITGTLWLNYKGKFYRAECIAWLGYGLSFMFQGMTAGKSYFLNTLAFGAGWLGFIMFGHLICLLVDWQHSLKPYVWAFGIGTAMTVLFHFLGFQTNLMAFPLVATLVSPCLVIPVIVVAKYRKRLTVIAWCYLITVFLNGLHGLDYAFLLNVPEAIFTGFTLATILCCALTSFATGAVLEKEARNATKLKLEAQYGTTMINSAKLAALGEMAGGVAHEINNPLQIIQGTHRLMRMAFNKNEIDPIYFEEKFTKLDETSNRISNIISGLIAFSRDGSKDPMERKVLKEIIDQTLDLGQKKIIEEGNEIKIV